jgi:hypothetical protein
LEKTQNAFYQYRNSVLGIMEVLTGDYSDLDKNITELSNKLINNENLELVKDILTKLG